MTRKDSATGRARTFLRIIEAVDRPVESGFLVLDFGCGAGRMVKELRVMGLHAVGCDLQFKDGLCLAGLKDAGCVKLIDTDPYRLLFDDGVFAAVVSDHAFEHVSGQRRP